MGIIIKDIKVNNYEFGFDECRDVAILFEEDSAEKWLTVSECVESRKFYLSDENILPLLELWSTSEASESDYKHFMDCSIDCFRGFKLSLEYPYRSVLSDSEPARLINFITRILETICFEDDDRKDLEKYFNEDISSISIDY